MHLPRDDTFLYEDAPRAGTGAVHAVCRTHFFIMGPACTIEMLPLFVSHVLAVDEIFQIVEYCVHSIKIKFEL